MINCKECISLDINLRKCTKEKAIIIAEHTEYHNLCYNPIKVHVSVGVRPLVGYCNDFNFNEEVE